VSAPVPPATADPSPIDAARDAYEHTRRLLFPFHFERWLTLGVVAFLEQCGRGGIGGALPGAPPGTGLPGGGPDLGNAGDLGAWFGAHLAVIVAAAVGILLVVVALVALVVWIGSRATFVYIDDVASGRAELKRPWTAHAERANSYFAWRFGLAAALLVAIFILIGVAALAALLLSRGGSSAVGGAVLLVVLVPAFIVVLLVGGLGAMALHDFVAPLQMEGRSCGAAVDAFLLLVRAYPLAFVLYVVHKIEFEVLRGMVLVVGACVTLCCVLVPVVTQTALQPLFFFERAWSLYLLRSMGHDLLGAPSAPVPDPGGPVGLSIPEGVTP
jgi:hypothetical protein